MPSIRLARPEDAGRIAEIYRPYVENTAVSFEYEAPDEREMRSRIERTLRVYPWLAAELDGRIAGYAYAGRFAPRKAYDFCAEASVYVDASLRRAGVGRALYAALEDILGRMNVLKLYACIAVSGDGDEYLTPDSVRFHERMGYAEVCRFDRCGFKFGRWYGTAWMEKALAPLTDCPKPLIPFAGLGAR